MGHIATVVVFIDDLHAIKGDQDFGFKMANAVSKLSLPTTHRPASGVPVHSGGSTAAIAIESHDVNYSTVLAFGGAAQVAEVISPAVHPSYRNEDEELKLRYLRALADQMGYSLRKKPERKKSGS